VKETRLLKFLFNIVFNCLILYGEFLPLEYLSHMEINAKSLAKFYNQIHSTKDLFTANWLVLGE